MANVFVLELFFVVLLHAGFYISYSFTDPSDSAALQSLKGIWQHTPPSWDESDDPCGKAWQGIVCSSNSRVTALSLSSVGIKGQLSGDIVGLTELRTLDLSYNPELTGPLSPRLGDLQKLNTLILAGCGFSGNIPDELGNLEDLTYLALNTNKLTGRIPPSLGKLSRLYWLDVAENQLTGSIPVSPGLDQLVNANHFHFNKNQLSGQIPKELFSPGMQLIHVLLDGNQLNGPIPTTIGQLQKLEILHLDRNALSGEVPMELSNLTSITDLSLAHNLLSGSLPDLSNMNKLKYVDLSNNSFDPTNAPDWFGTLSSLNTLVMEYGTLHGPVPPKLFILPQLFQMKLRNNNFTILNMSEGISPQLQLIDLQGNQISSENLVSGEYKLMLLGNPACNNTFLSNTPYCQLEQVTENSYSTSTVRCGSKTTCLSNQKLNPQSCECAFPFEGELYFRGPSFRDVSNATRFQALEFSLRTQLDLPVSLQNPFFNLDEYLQVELAVFPSTGKYFNRTEIQRIGFELSNQTFNPPEEFGPYYFIASPYAFP